MTDHSKSPVARRAERIRKEGFDRSRVSATGYVHVVCSQCEAIVINGVACHEYGCPNKQRRSAANRRA